MKPHDLNTPQPGNPNTQLLNDTVGVGTTYGKAAGWPDGSTVPVEIVEAILNEETGGDLENCGSNCPWQGVVGNSAVWPMNVEPNGGEAAYWEQITGHPFADTIPQHYPTDIDANIDVGILGLGHDYQSTSVAGKPASWFDVGMTYFSGDPNPETAKVKSDGNETGQEYHDHLKAYVTQTYGPDTAAILERGDWMSTDPGNYAYVDYVTHAIDQAKNYVQNQVSGVVGGMLSALGRFAAAYLPRAGIALLGLVFLAFGLHRLMS